LSGRQFCDKERCNRAGHGLGPRLQIIAGETLL
jgi:hypothetical protein